MKNILNLVRAVVIAFPIAATFAAQTQDTEYEAVAEEYIKGYLAAHPLHATSLGFHEYDGKISDFSGLALDAELTRIRRFDDRLKKFDLDKLSARQSIDLRILQAAIKQELFAREVGGARVDRSAHPAGGDQARALRATGDVEPGTQPDDLRAGWRFECLHQTKLRADRGSRAQHRANRATDSKHHHRGKDEPESGIAEAVCRTCDPDRERFLGVF